MISSFVENILCFMQVFVPSDLTAAFYLVLAYLGLLMQSLYSHRNPRWKTKCKTLELHQIVLSFNMSIFTLLQDMSGSIFIFIILTKSSLIGIESQKLSINKKLEIKNLEKDLSIIYNIIYIIYGAVMVCPLYRHSLNKMK